MKNKKTFLIAAIIISSASIYAHDLIRSAGVMTWEWDTGKDSLKDLREDDKRFWGIQSEYIHHNVGYGMDALVDFYRIGEDQSMLDWQGMLFMRYHLFGSSSFLDPFIEAGIGNAGTVNLGDGNDLKLSLYPSLSAGVNAVFSGGFFMGGRWSYRADEWEIPGTSYAMPELGRYQVSFYAGVSYGSSAHNSYVHYHYD